MNELSLFSGAGGGLLGTVHLLGWTPVGYVEIDDYCCRVLEARIRDGLLPEAPIWQGDIRAFNARIAPAYRRKVDVITAGFPCQPFSVAGKRGGEDDERNMWPATVECIRIVRPRYCFMENVPGLVSSRYFATILGDLAESGFDARWRVLSAAELGAPHRRKRLWIVAVNTDCIEQGAERGVCGGAIADATGSGGDVAEPQRRRRRPGGETTRREEGASTHGLRSDGPTDVADGASIGVERVRAEGVEVAEAHAGAEVSQRNGDRIRWWDIDPADLPNAMRDEGPTESRVGRVAHGMADRVDRLRTLGNGQVPAVAAAAWRLSMGSDCGKTGKIVLSRYVPPKRDEKT